VSPAAPPFTRRARRLSRAHARAAAREIAARFTEREIEILQAVIDHAGVEQAASVLGVSEGYVRNTLSRMRSEAGVQATYQLTLVASHRLHVPNGWVQKAP
jgi:DNA-binding NarL/FixJ family response regulator